ncbi:MAG: ATP-binding cassette domain-containing protein [Cyclobacteriaceae bacterium]|nr:ATP-binding cassette domain-containing protein [Cyclobacteriaceae bacterium]
MAKRRLQEPLREEDKRKVNKDSLKRLAGIFRFMLPHKWLFIAGLICLVLSSATVLSFPYLAGQLLDLASGKTIPYFTTINQVALTLLAILIVQGFFSYMRVYTFSVTTERTLADLRQHVFQKIVWLPLSFFDNRRVGELMSRITSDVGTLQDTFTTTMAELLRQSLTLVIGTAIISFIAPQLTVFMLLTFPVLVIFALIFGKSIRKLSRKTQDKLAEANVIVEESLQTIQVVKAFTNEAFELLRFKKSLNEVVQVAIRTAKYRGLFVSFVILALFGGIVLVGWYGAWLVQSNLLSVGELFSFIIYTSFIGGSIAGLGDLYTQLQRSIGASERLLEILDQKDEEELPATVAPRLSGDIVFNEVNFSYPTRPDFPVLKDLNFHIRAGEKIALVGQSGSGKSTIINLLLRFYPVQTGSIEAEGLSIQSFSLTDYRKNIGIVPQEVILFGGTIRENIAYGNPGASFEAIRLAAQKASALDFIESFPEQFDTLVGERGVKLSGGQRQRIAIARAILKNPSILVLDEATSSLDSQSEYLVQQALDKLMEGRTTIIIAHRLSTIKKVDRIFVINQGMLAEVGSHAELTQVNNGLYSNLLKMQLHEQ